MGLVFVQHVADHTFIDQDRLRRSRRREDQFRVRSSLPVRQTDTTDGYADKRVGGGADKKLDPHPPSESIIVLYIKL